MVKTKSRKNIKGLNEWGLALLLALIFALLIKGFVVQSFMVASTKMEKTILAGDYIMVNKVVFGARLPITLLSVPLFPSIYFDLVQLPFIHLPPIKYVAKGDLVVFNYPTQFNLPVDKRETMVKRCVALPRDTIKIVDKKVYINDKDIFNEILFQFNYRIVTNGETLNQEFLNKYDINEGGMVSEIGIYDFPLDKERLDLIKAEKNIRYVREVKDFSGDDTRFIFPTGRYYNFNKDNFGQLVIPFKGQVVLLNMQTIELYKDIITEYEGNDLIINGSKIFINGIETSKYNIKNNYYFMLDDNRDNAKDSRYWGFLPETHIIGKASFVWFSYDSLRGQIRWNRIFKSIE